MRKFKTSEKNRTHYVYYNAKGKPTVLKPEADGVDNTWITLLHKEDDEWLDAERRNEYYAPVHYDAYYDGNGDESADCNPYLSDEKTNPLNRIIETIEKQEHDEKITDGDFQTSASAEGINKEKIL